MNIGDYIDYTYTGAIQTFIPQDSGIYKLEVWGGSGATGTKNYSSGYGSPGNGGYSVGYKKLKKGITYYIGVGGRGHESSKGSSGSGGYNGGGNAGGPAIDYSEDDYFYGGGGGGCTHIALLNGTLSTIGSGNLSQVLLVAGGGGGSARNANGGNGGGLVGNDSNNYYATNSSGGTQTTGYAFGQGQSGSSNGAGAGGGLYGGHASGQWSTSGCGGAGGSGFIDNVDDVVISGISYQKSTTNGANNGNGKAKITFMKKSSIKLGENDCDVYLGDEEIVSVYIGNTQL